MRMTVELTISSDEGIAALGGNLLKAFALYGPTASKTLTDTYMIIKYTNNMLSNAHPQHSEL